VSEKDEAPRVLAGRYQLLHMVGRGGMGSVWMGKHLSLGTPVAVKLLEPRLAASEALRTRFLREARAAATLKSANVVQILDHGVEGDTPYIVMELLEGESLGTRLRRMTKLAPEEVARVFSGVGRAISRAHKAGIIHRDLKPDNIFLARDEDGAEIVKVVDFGIAKIVEGEGLGDVSTDTGTMMGTPHYMSPEQARGVKDLDKRVDTWALAVIAFECLVGQRPFTADAFGELVIRICLDPVPVPSSIGPVPAGFDEWFDRATRRPIDERFQSTAELIQSLEDVLTPGRHSFVDPLTDPRVSGAGSPASDPTGFAATITSPQLKNSGGKVPSSPSAPVLDEEPRSPTHGTSVHSITPTPVKTSRRTITFGIAAVAVATPLVVFWAVHRGDSAKTRTEESSSRSVVASLSAEASTRTAVASPPVSPSAMETASGVAVTPKDVTLRLPPKLAGAEVHRGKDRVAVVGDAMTLPFGREPIELTIDKPGFQTAIVKLTPDKDQTIDVALKPGGQLGPPSSEDYGY